MEQKEKDNKRFTTPGGAGLAAICFFLPWIRACGQDISGSQIASNGEALLWLVLIAAIVIVFGFVVYEGQDNLEKLKPFVLGGAILSLIILVIEYVKVSEQGSGMFEVRYGSVGTLLGFIASLFGLKYLEGSVPIEVENSVVTIFCTECGAKNSSISIFCSECGAKSE